MVRSKGTNFLLLLFLLNFQPENKMFVYHPTKRLYWFTIGQQGSHREYNLIGVLMGLAVYNSIILDIRFPSICFKLVYIYDDYYSKSLCIVNIQMKILIKTECFPPNYFLIILFQFSAHESTTHESPNWNGICSFIQF